MVRARITIAVSSSGLWRVAGLAYGPSADPRIPEALDISGVAARRIPLQCFKGS